MDRIHQNALVPPIAAAADAILKILSEFTLCDRLLVLKDVRERKLAELEKRLFSAQEKANECINELLTAQEFFQITSVQETFEECLEEDSLSNYLDKNKQS